MNNMHIHLFNFDVALNWHFSTPFIINISVAPPLDPITFDKQRIISSVVTKIGSEVGAG